MDNFRDGSTGGGDTIDDRLYFKDSRPGPHTGLLYTHFLHHVHNILQPRSYFEIGTESGASVDFVECDAVCVDPNFKLDRNIMSRKSFLALFQTTSDLFFSKSSLKHFFPTGPDISFLDGMHRFEYLLRDFYNLEPLCHSRSLVFLHDCLPQNERMARRVHINGPEEEGETRFAWTGDVWKMIPILKKYRPDLRIFFLDCPPTGLVAISGIDPSSNVLRKEYYNIVDEFRDISLDGYGLNSLWDAYAMLDTNSLHKNGHDLTAFFTAY